MQDRKWALSHLTQWNILRAFTILQLLLHPILLQYPMHPILIYIHGFEPGIFPISISDFWYFRFPISDLRLPKYIIAEVLPTISNFQNAFVLTYKERTWCDPPLWDVGVFVLSITRDFRSRADFWPRETEIFWRLSLPMGFNDERADSWRWRTEIRFRFIWKAHERDFLTGDFRRRQNRFMATTKILPWYLCVFCARYKETWASQPYQWFSTTKLIHNDEDDFVGDVVGRTGTKRDSWGSETPKINEPTLTPSNHVGKFW